MPESRPEYLRIPRDATFPTLPVPTDFQEYAHAYFVGAKELWEKSNKFQPTQADQAPMPDNLVYPILFLVHHFLELELKSGIELTYSIGNITGEIAEEPNWQSGDLLNHDLDSLLSLLKVNLAKLDGMPEGYPSEPTCELIEDVAKFGVLGQLLRYPIWTIKEKTREKAFGNTRLCCLRLIPDVAAVIAACEKAWLDFGGLISYLIEYEDHLQTSQR